MTGVDDQPHGHVTRVQVVTADGNHMSHYK